MRSPLVAITLVLGTSLAVGCSWLSNSSRSVSKSVSSPLRSSSRSSGGAEDPAYMREIRDYAYGYARSGAEPGAFSRGVGALAGRRGISNWEDDQDTCRAIGEGFRAAGIGRTAAEEMIGRTVQPSSRCAAWMRAGFDSK